VSIVVPCHRVVREDGNLAGYRWGLSRKRTLLDRELAAISKQTESAGESRRKSRSAS
jgi:AraC family transcriptional regulator of adaptative response/methylated-DNA-[protein]-cysteine methyltransferase